MGKITFLDHPADIYIRVESSGLLDLYATAGKALFEAMTDTSRVSGRYERSVEAEGFDMENLLYRWLEELLSIYYIENIMCGVVRVREIRVVSEDGEEKYIIQGTCLGEEFNPERHEARVEVKAVTYSLMKIIRGENGWFAEFVLDI